jgi:hypothetical protein
MPLVVPLFAVGLTGFCLPIVLGTPSSARIASCVVLNASWPVMPMRCPSASRKTLKYASPAPGTGGMSRTSWPLAGSSRLPIVPCSGPGTVPSIAIVTLPSVSRRKIRPLMMMKPRFIGLASVYEADSRFVTPDLSETMRLSPSSEIWSSRSHGEGSVKYGSPRVRTSAWSSVPTVQPRSENVSCSVPVSYAARKPSHCTYSVWFEPCAVGVNW